MVKHILRTRISRLDVLPPPPPSVLMCVPIIFVRVFVLKRILHKLFLRQLTTSFPTPPSSYSSLQHLEIAQINNLELQIYKLKY